MRLAISVNIGEDENANETDAVNVSKEILKLLEQFTERFEITASLIRDGDRSQGNLLVTKVEGRFGSHYRNKKADIKEILKK